MKLLSKVLHDKAMEFVDEARLATMEGDKKASKAFYEKAFTLEKEAALSLPPDNDNDFSKSLYLRSAAWLAYNAGNYWEALQLVKMGLEENPPDFLVQQLLELQEKLNLTGLSMLIKGVLTHADAKDHEITIEDRETERAYSIVVPDNMSEIVKKYWSDFVAVEAKTTSQGLIVLEKISRAA